MLVKEAGAKALASKLPFDELAMFERASPIIKRALHLESVVVEEVTDGAPGSPVFSFAS